APTSAKTTFSAPLRICVAIKIIMKRILLLVFLVVAAIVALYGYREYNRKNVDLTDVQPTVQANAASLIKAFESDTAAATRTYVNQVIEVTGQVKNIDKDGNPVVIFLGADNSMSSVKCSMDSSHAASYDAVAKGATVTIKGTCTGYQAEELLGTDVEMTRCVIRKK
ncbi:MAG: hypothetical protein JWP27_1208, partial [Flaviaesturariibacter sp.]|nr:hypothetical protein [Flaviaesturariibacter sp.]